MPYTLAPATEAHYSSLHRAIDIVAREEKYLAFIQAPPLEQSFSFYRALQVCGAPHFVVLDGEGEVVGWVDVSPQMGEARAHIGTLGIALLPVARRQGLGERLMRAQDDALLAWIDRGGLDTSSTQEAVAQNVLLMNEIIEITRAFPGQIAILRALRAVPGLREVRLASRDMVAARLAEAIAPSLPNVPFETLCIATRMTTEMGTTAAEMVLEEPQLDREIIVQQVTRATVAYYDALRATTMPAKAKTKAKS